MRRMRWSQMCKWLPQWLQLSCSTSRTSRVKTVPSGQRKRMTSPPQVCLFPVCYSCRARHSSRLSAKCFFKLRQVLLGLLLLDGVAAQIAVGGPVGADVDLLAVTMHGALGGLDALGLFQVVGQFLVGPVGAVEPAAGWAADDPGADL